MKLSEKHAREIQEKIVSSGFKIEDFSFVKKRGWIYINHLPTGNFLSFFHRKNVIIDSERHQWANNHYFEIKNSNKDKLNVLTWHELTLTLVNWLENIPKQ